MPWRWRPRRPRAPWACPPSSQIAAIVISISMRYRKNSGCACCPGGGAPDDLACPGRIPRALTHAFFRARADVCAVCSLRSHAAAPATPPSRKKASVHSELPWTSRTLDAWARGRSLLPTRATPQTWTLMQACRPAPARALGPATAATPRLRCGTTTPRASYATRFSPHFSACVR